MLLSLTPEVNAGTNLHELTNVALLRSKDELNMKVLQYIRLRKAIYVIF
jgi:hypothetical protein